MYHKEYTLQHITGFLAHRRENNIKKQKRDLSSRAALDGRRQSGRRPGSPACSHPSWGLTLTFSLVSKRSLSADQSSSSGLFTNGTLLWAKEYSWQLSLHLIRLVGIKPALRGPSQTALFLRLAHHVSPHRAASVRGTHPESSWGPLPP